MEMSQAPITNLSPSQYNLRAVRLEDGPAIVQLLNQVFGHWGSLEDWRWKYVLPPTSTHLESYLAEFQGRIIGHYGILPLDALWEGKPEPAAQAVDAGVLPDYRRSGVFTNLALLTLRQAAQNGVRLIYAFPGLRSLSANQRFGFRAVTFVPEMMRVVNFPRALNLMIKSLPEDLLALSAIRRPQGKTPEAIYRLVRLRRMGYLLASMITAPRLPSLLKPLRKEVILSQTDHFDHRIDAFWTKFAESNPFGLVKDSCYLNWRYCDHPSVTYHITLAEYQGQIVGCLVIRHKGLRSEIAELMAHPKYPKIQMLLLEAAIQQARGSGDILLSAWANAQHSGFSALRQAGFSTPTNLFKLAESVPALSRQLYQVIAFTEHLTQDQQNYLRCQMKNTSFSLGDSDLV